jgi:hypothetical protein
VKEEIADRRNEIKAKGVGVTKSISSLRLAAHI